MDGGQPCPGASGTGQVGPGDAMSQMGTLRPGKQSKLAWGHTDPMAELRATSRQPSSAHLSFFQVHLC